MQRFVRLPILVLGLAACLAHAQSTPKQIEEILGRRILDPILVEFQLKEYLMGRVPPLPKPPPVSIPPIPPLPPPPPVSVPPVPPLPPPPVLP